MRNGGTKKLYDFAINRWTHEHKTPNMVQRYRKRNNKQTNTIFIFMNLILFNYGGR